MKKRGKKKRGVEKLPSAVALESRKRPGGLHDRRRKARGTTRRQAIQESES